MFSNIKIILLDVSFFRLTLDEVCQMLQEEQEETDNESDFKINVAIEPPIEETTADTDCDSDASDSKVTCNPNHLPRRILLSEVLTDKREDQMPSPDGKQRKKKLRKENVVWHRDETKVIDSVGDYDMPSEEQQVVNESILECIGHFWTDDWLKIICEQSRVYAHQKSLQSDVMTVDNLRVFFWNTSTLWLQQAST